MSQPRSSATGWWRSASAGPWPALAPDRGGDEAGEDAEAAALRAQLAGSDLDPERQRLLFDLGQFHRREAKPAWWATFDSLGRDTDELVDDLDCLGGLEATGPAWREGGALVRDYRFPEQETRLKPGQSPTAPLADPFVSLTLAELDRRARRATVKIGAGKDIDLPERLSLHPPRPIPTDGLAAAVRAAIADQCGPRSHRAIDDLLARRAPRLDGGGGRGHPRRRGSGRGDGARRAGDAGHGAADPGSARHRQDPCRRPRHPRAVRGGAAGRRRLDQPRGDLEPAPRLPRGAAGRRDL